MKETRTALAADAPDGAREILAPTVGRWLGAPPLGMVVSPGARVGELRILAKGVDVLVPDGVAGVVSEVLVRTPAFVERGQPLFRVGRESALAAAAAAVEEAAAGATAEEDIPEGMLAVRAPTDGIFYRRPSPDEPAYVEEGDTIERGAVLGLVEVMKCFNQIVWRPEGGPAKAKVAKTLAGDSAEVKLGEALFWLEPA